MMFRIGKYETKSQSFIGYEYIEFPSVEQAKRFCREADTEGYVYAVVREEKDRD